MHSVTRTQDFCGAPAKKVEPNDDHKGKEKVDAGAYGHIDQCEGANRPWRGRWLRDLNKVDNSRNYNHV